MYYRYANKNNKMSDFGHAMFAIDTESIEDCYGDTLYTYDGTDGVKIEDIKDKIINAWNECLKDGFDIFNDDYFENLDAETIYNMFNPSDIVMSAEGWDNAFTVTWFWEYVAEPNNINAIITQDGAIVFDEDLIQTQK